MTSRIERFEDYQPYENRNLKLFEIAYLCAGYHPDNDLLEHRKMELINIKLQLDAHKKGIPMQQSADQFIDSTPPIVMSYIKLMQDWMEGDEPRNPAEFMENVDRKLAVQKVLLFDDFEYLNLSQMAIFSNIPANPFINPELRKEPFQEGREAVDISAIGNLKPEREAIATVKAEINGKPESKGASASTNTDGEAFKAGILTRINGLTNFYKMKTSNIVCELEDLTGLRDGKMKSDPLLRGERTLQDWIRAAKKEKGPLKRGRPA